MLETYVFGHFQLDVARRVVMFRGVPVKLTAKSIAVLTQLARRAPEVVTRAEFEAAVWPEGYIEASNLTQTIYMIRRVFGRLDPHPVIDTYNGNGYRLALAVRLVMEPEMHVTTTPLPVFGRMASSIVLAVGVACASAFLATRDAPPVAPATAHVVAHATAGGTLSRRANAALRS